MTLFRSFFFLLLGLIFAFAPLAFETGEKASSDWTPFIASFHPLVLHLPIGIIAALCSLELWMVLRKKADPGVRSFLWLIAALSASFSFATGYLLGEEGGYDKDLLGKHLWAAGAFTSICWFSCALVSLESKAVVRFSALAAALIAMCAAGHYGGLMVHGDPMENAPWKQSAPAGSRAGLLPELGDTINVYTDIVHPIIDAKCVQCHGPKKKKGKLRLDSYDALMAGGEYGPAIEAGSSADSLLVELLEYPIDDEDHMPPEDEHQLTAGEIEIIKWWIDAGAHPDRSLEEAQLPVEVEPFLIPEYRLIPDPTLAE